MAVAITLGTQADVDALEFQYRTLQAQLPTLPFVDVSEAGRSISGAGTRTAILAQMAAIREQIAAMAGPVFNVSRMRA